MAETRPPLTSTSYALLGLLAIKSWTTYELAQQMDRTLSRFWPRARSKVYEEPKKLAALGLAKATKEATGRRPRTVYTITAKGRRALAAWLAEPSDGPAFESEHVLKAFFAPSGTTADLLATLEHLRDWVAERTEVTVEVGRRYVAGRGDFPERAAINMLVGRVVDDVLEVLDRWAEWATAIAEQWPDDPSEARVDWAEFERTLDQAIARGARYASAARARERSGAPG